MAAALLASLSITKHHSKTMACHQQLSRHPIDINGGITCGATKPRAASAEKK